MNCNSYLHACLKKKYPNLTEPQKKYSNIGKNVVILRIFRNHKKILHWKKNSKKNSSNFSLPPHPKIWNTVIYSEFIWLQIYVKKFRSIRKYFGYSRWGLWKNFKKHSVIILKISNCREFYKNLKTLKIFFDFEKLCWDKLTKNSREILVIWWKSSASQWWDT